MAEEESDWAVAFALPGDWEGIHQIVRIANIRPREYLKAPIANFGDAESLTVFDNVFVPWERVFLCGERDMGGRIALLFALYHRHSYTGCKPSLTDILMGTTALVAEYNGVETAQHIRIKLAHMIGIAELVYAAGIASAVHSEKSTGGPTFQIASTVMLAGVWRERTYTMNMKYYAMLLEECTPPYLMSRTGLMRKLGATWKNTLCGTPRSRLKINIAVFA